MEITDRIKKSLWEAVKTALPQAEIKPEEILLEHPTAEEHGDYSTNIALRLGKQSGKSSQEVAKKIITHLQETTSLEATVAGRARLAEAEAKRGFINFTLTTDTLVSQMRQVLKEGESYGTLELADKKIAIEIVSPNINKPLHIGHLRNGALGMSLANLYEASGWKVIRDEINNDRGLHIVKGMLGYLVLGRKSKEDNKFGKINWKDLLAEWVRNPQLWDAPDAKIKPDQFVGHFYMQGERLLADFKEPTEKSLSEMLQAWEAENPDIWKLWKVMGDWVHRGIDQTYERIGVKHDKKWYEHLLYKEGKKVVLEALDKGIFERLPDGAVQADLEKHGLANKILVRRDGTAIYMTFDIALTKHKVAEFKADKYVWVVGNDQIDHFKRLFVIFEMLGLGSREKFHHLAYGMVRVPGGKMSSRLGNVILADDLLDKMAEMAKKLMSDRKIGTDASEAEKNGIAEAVGVGAIKYTLLKVNPILDVTFDPEKSVSLEGDSGPYLQYTYARARSVLRKANEQWAMNNGQSINNETIKQFSNEELAVLRYLYRFPEVVEVAAKQYAPNLVCSYLFELARRFNNFYNNQPILGSENEAFRLGLTGATSIILKNGLNLLGIQSLEKM